MTDAARGVRLEREWRIANIDGIAVNVEPEGLIVSGYGCTSLLLDLRLVSLFSVGHAIGIVTLLICSGYLSRIVERDARSLVAQRTLERLDEHFRSLRRVTKCVQRLRHASGVGSSDRHLILERRGLESRQDRGLDVERHGRAVPVFHRDAVGPDVLVDPRDFDAGRCRNLSIVLGALSCQLSDFPAGRIIHLGNI